MESALLTSVPSGAPAIGVAVPWVLIVLIVPVRAPPRARPPPQLEPAEQLRGRSQLAWGRGAEKPPPAGSAARRPPPAAHFPTH